MFCGASSAHPANISGPTRAIAEASKSAMEVRSAARGVCIGLDSHRDVQIGHARGFHAAARGGQRDVGSLENAVLLTERRQESGERVKRALELHVERNDFEILL